MCSIERHVSVGASTFGPSKKIKRVLLRNPAILGDMLYTLRVAAVLKANYPDIRIGILAGRWTRPLLELSPDIDIVHFEDEWLFARKSKGILTAIINHIKLRSRLIKDIKNQHYDMGVDLYYHFPFGSYLLWQADIIERIGYDCNGGACLLTKAIPWHLVNQHNFEYQVKLLQEVGFSMNGYAEKIPAFKFRASDEEILQKYHLYRERYVVLHIGTSAPIREWKNERWRELSRYLIAKGFLICFTGKGEGENAKIAHVTGKNLMNCLSLCDKLSMGEFFQVVRNARLFVGVESFAGHVAALYQVPQVSIMHGATNLYHWQPYNNENCRVIRSNVECSPCYAPRNCKNHNMCMDISLEAVVEGVEDILRKSEKTFERAVRIDG
jgi:lipopolysaccharide heptosyltransferase III